MSVRTSIPSEYTRMILLETDGGKGVSVSKDAKKVKLAHFNIQSLFANHPSSKNRFTNNLNKQASKKSDPKKVVDSNIPRTISLPSFGIGFGDLTATADNLPPNGEIEKLPEVAEMFVKAASNCCGATWDKCCCMCCIQCCSQLNNQCAIVLTQLIAALSCMACFGCCELCCPGNDGR